MRAAGESIPGIAPCRAERRECGVDVIRDSAFLQEAMCASERWKSVLRVFRAFLRGRDVVSCRTLQAALVLLDAPNWGGVS